MQRKFFVVVLQEMGTVQCVVTGREHVVHYHTIDCSRGLGDKQRKGIHC
jgi:hypothetical protein